MVLIKHYGVEWNRSKLQTWICHLSVHTSAQSEVMGFTIQSLVTMMNQVLRPHAVPFLYVIGTILSNMTTPMIILQESQQTT
jgi:hypothetical protein